MEVAESDIPPIVDHVGSPVITGFDAGTVVDAGVYVANLALVFEDGDGDADHIEFEIIAQQGGGFRLRDFGVDVPPQVQRRGGATFEFGLNCSDDSSFSNDIEITLVDDADNRSDPVTFRIKCCPVDSKDAEVVTILN